MINLNTKETYIQEGEIEVLRNYALKIKVKCNTLCLVGH